MKQESVNLINQASPEGQILNREELMRMLRVISPEIERLKNQKILNAHDKAKLEVLVEKETKLILQMRNLKD